MIVREITSLPKPIYKPMVDMMIRTAEDMIPDSIDKLNFSTLVDFNVLNSNRSYEQLAVILHIHVVGCIPDPDGVFRDVIQQRFAFSTFIEGFRIDDKTYSEFIKRSMTHDVANLLMNIIHFAKTGEILKDESTGGLKQLI